MTQKLGDPLKRPRWLRLMGLMLFIAVVVAAAWFVASILLIQFWAHGD